MEPMHARAQLFHILTMADLRNEKDRAGIASFIQKHQNDLPQESFGDFALLFEGALKRKPGRKKGDGKDLATLAREYGRRLAQVGSTIATKTNAKIKACQAVGLEAQNGRTLDKYMEQQWFSEIAYREEKLCRAWGETLELIVAVGPDITKSEAESLLRSYLIKAVEISPDDCHMPGVRLPSGDFVMLSRAELDL